MKRIVLMLLISILGISFQCLAQGDLLITPKRVVFEGNKQKAELNLMNTGTDTATYSISFRQYNMSEEGKLELNKKLDTLQMFADPFLRVFPRQVTLAPGEGQIIMLQCRRKSNMKAGEYRSHLWFRDEKNYSALQKQEKSLLDIAQLSVSVIAVYGITIPVIIRSGEVEAGAALSDLKLEPRQDTLQYLKLTVHRTGNISVMGKLIVEYNPLQGKPYQVGMINMGIYTNLDKRDISLKLNSSSGKILKNGVLKVRYISNDENKEPVVYAEGELDI